MSSDDIYDICIIGGGIVGASIAYQLTKRGKSVILFDRNDKGRATSAGAGIISPPTTYTDNEKLYQFQIEAGKFYPILNNELTLEFGQDTSFKSHPKVVIPVDEDEIDEYNKIETMILNRRRKENYPSESVLHTLNRDEVKSRFPNVRMSESTKTAIINENGAKINGIMFCNALLIAAKNLGLVINHSSIEILVEEPDDEKNGRRKLLSVTDGENTWTAKEFVVAGGFWTKKLIKQLGVNLPLDPQRGQIVHLHHPDLDTSQIPTISAFHGHYIVPWEDGNIVCGATREAGIEEVNATVNGIQEVLSEGLRVVPELKNASVIEVRVGIRPVSKTGLPIFGMVPGFINLYVSTGHGPLGLTLGPYTGKLMSQLILGEDPDIDISDFAPKTTEN